VFAQEDAYGDAGFAGVAKAFRSRGLNDAGIVRLGYKRNTIDVEQALAGLRAQRVPVKALVMVASYRAAAKFIERTRDAHPDMIYTNVSFVGSTELANELMLLGPRFAKGVVVTQVVPAVGNDSSVVLEYKKALAKAFPSEAVDYVSFEGYEAANVLIEGLRRTGRAVDTEKLIDALEQMRRVDLGIGVPVSFNSSEHQALHKVWGSMLNAAGKYDPIDLQ
jgi:ABC-type branched-subunit amino acid transport system substrate-binding protein